MDILHVNVALSLAFEYSLPSNDWHFSVSGLVLWARAQSGQTDSVLAPVGPVRSIGRCATISDELRHDVWWQPSCFLCRHLLAGVGEGQARPPVPACLPTLSFPCGHRQILSNDTVQSSTGNSQIIKFVKLEQNHK